MRQLVKPVVKTLKRPRVFPEYKQDHQVGAEVPLNGSCCLSCHYLGKDGVTCTEDKFVKWNHSNAKLPLPANRYCCDFWKPKEKSLLK
jgi:hypothetical protein